MLPNVLFAQTKKVNERVKRNITYIASPAEAFASLSSDKTAIPTATASIKRARQSIAGGKYDLSDFYYTAAIAYPFESKPYMQTRFSNGTYPVWYGAKQLKTTIYETAYHCAKEFFVSEIDNRDEKILKKRSIFDVDCDAILLDVVAKAEDYPELISDNYQFCNQFAKEVQQNKLPGILSRSARDEQGVNVNIFDMDVLDQPQHVQDLRYYIYPQQGYIEITGLSEQLTVTFEQLGLVIK